ncbi:mitogen-activated protein kinase kinase kinase 5 [Cynara cardunculus var. scolymus]|uniref:mitogen-activated protein kinase kinase kinase 5 n=1 Tax=Cynara cardunculus var. scolymus TaxID=59895 RepID=UPI000D62AAD6|nr:mitogen-activated protein kinase kinase kinase 5 [Cynara cardunculus var. scolymus]
MHWWQNASSHSSSSSPSSDDNFMNHNNGTHASKLASLFTNSHGHANSFGYIQRRRLTRARKLRHLTDNDIGHAPARLMVKPVPLPLPELDFLFKHDAHKKAGEKRATSNIYDGDIKEIQRAASADTLRDREDVVSQNGGVVLRNRQTHTGSFSAPASPVSSPVNSPTSTTEMFLPYYMPPPTLQIWSARENPIPDITPGAVNVSWKFPDAYLVGSSSTSSPRQKTGVRSSIRSNSSLHKNMAIENTMGRRDSNAQAIAHPLPLPPGATMPPPSSPPQVNSRPDSRPTTPRLSQWQKGKLLGCGTFGSVYVGSNRETGALCAMKEVQLLPDDPKAAECIKQLEQEIDVLSQLKHPNIVQYYGSEIVDDRFYIYLEYVHPGSINKYVRDHCGGMTESIVRNFTRHIVSGLAYLHSTRTIHRDIKGANLLVDVNGVVKLADFGMAKHLSGQAGHLSLKGSPYWMAPELLQLETEKDVDPDLALAVDIWSLGCTIIEMFDGKPPWSEYEGPAAMFKVIKENPSIPEKMSPEGKDFLRCCFIRNPAERPTASMLLEHRFLKTSNDSHVPYNISMDKELLHQELDRLLVPACTSTR